MDKKTYLIYRQLTILLTLDCNLRCKYCFEKDNHKKEYISKNTIEDIKKTITQDTDFLCTDIEFFGGEPMLAQDIIIDFIHFFKDKLFYKIMTNGTIAFDDFIKQTKMYANNITIDMSWDGTDINYLRNSSLEKIQYARNKLLENNYHVYITSVFTKEFSKNVVKNVLQLCQSFDIIRIKRLVHIASEQNDTVKHIADNINKLIFSAIYVKFKYHVHIYLPDNMNYSQGKEGFSRRSYLCDTFTALCTTVGTDGKLYPCEPLAAIQKQSYADSIKDWRKKTQFYEKLEYNKSFTDCRMLHKSNQYYDQKTENGRILYNKLFQKLNRLKSYIGGVYELQY